MLRELIDTALLEDFATGLARACRLRIGVYDGERRLIAAATGAVDSNSIETAPPRELATCPEQTPMPVTGPPALVGIVAADGVGFVVAPVFLNERRVGYVAVGPLEEAEPRGDRPAVVAARWSSRMLSAWCRRESRLQTAGEELALVGDIAELLTGERDLQTILDRIVAETARVMQCRFCSLRLYDPKTDELTIKSGHNLSQRYLDKGRILRTENPIDDQALSGKLVYIEDSRTDERIRFPEEARRQGIVSALTAGMIYRGQPIGVLRVYTDRPRRFHSVQRNLLRAVAAQAATGIAHARLVEERLRAAEVERQVELAGQVQARMIGDAPPEHPAVETAFIFNPSSHVAGDFCDFFKLADGRLAAVVADVVGKGVPASLLMASVRGALRATAERTGNLGEIVTSLNRHVCSETATGEFLSLLLVAVDGGGRRLSYCNGGHEPLLRLRGGKIHAPDEGGLVLGLDPGEAYVESTIDLRPRDFVLLLTDGAIEAMDFRSELFGRERLLAALTQYGSLSAEQALKNVLWDIRRFVGLADQSDDITLLGLRVRDDGEVSGS